MKKNLLNTFKLGLLATLMATSTAAYAAEEATTPPDVDWPYEGIFGTYDQASVQRGFQVYREVCAACHSMDHLAYRNLAQIGYNEAEVKAIASEYYITDGPNDDGEMFERPGKPSDTFKAPYPNDKAARYANGGAFPPDLSMIVKAREHGADYVYGILTGYEEAPADAKLMSGQYWNKYMAGHKIAMPPPITDGMTVYSDGTAATVEQASYDVSQFLAWASEPHLAERKSMGLKAILYMIIFTIILYMTKKKIWQRRKDD